MIDAYLARPSGPGPHPGVVVIHHMPGWDEATKEIARKFAHHGYTAISPNLHFREGKGTPEENSASIRAAGGMPDERTMGDVEGAIAYLRTLPYLNGKVGIIGYCSGGRQVYLAACTLRGIDAAIDCYGGGVVAKPEELTGRPPGDPASDGAHQTVGSVALRKESDMSTIVESIDVAVPIRVAYDQWTQFEEFPRFMEGVKRVQQLDDTTLEWTAEIGGVERSWRAEITEQEPDTRIAWRSTSGAKNAGQVAFQPTADNMTRITLQLDVEPEGPLEAAGDALGLVERQAEGDLRRFKEFIELRGTPTGSWRGEVAAGNALDRRS